MKKTKYFLENKKTQEIQKTNFQNYCFATAIISFFMPMYTRYDIDMLSDFCG